MNFKDKIALITGGTSGIGKEISKQLLLNGAVVIINYSKNDHQTKDTLEELKEYSKQIILIKANVANENEVSKMFQEINDKFGKLDFLINNAGISIDSFIEYFNMEDWNKVISVNLTGKFLCVKYAIKLLRNSSNGSIVNIASRLGAIPCAEASAYCVAEAGIINFTKCAAIEFAKDNVRVNCISPSLTITPMALSGWSDEEIEMTKEKNPMKRLGEPIDIANMALYLVSDEAKYITGQNINVNGGALL